ncbi:hypothetical protein D210916BOD24_07700 [Alteromonas sp. D210916BOD_24]|uniref:hypothetical protein n=1 Tax=Alteromonas sp. D210916BOD_24 TaxID=3157618 RepID=UPI00399CCDF4
MRTFFSHIFLLCIISFYSGVTLAVADEGRYIIGYVSHPRVVNYYKPLIEEVYREIGINTEFVEVGGEPGLRLLNEGMTDADVIRYDVVTQYGKDIVAIEPAFALGTSFLLCIRKVPCSKDVIQNPDIAIAVTTRFFFNIGQQPDNLAASIHEFDDFNHVIELLINGRFNYAILPSDYSQNAIFDKHGIRYIPIVKHKLVHVINKKHMHLYSALSDAITKRVKASLSN